MEETYVIYHDSGITSGYPDKEAAIEAASREARKLQRDGYLGECRVYKQIPVADVMADVQTTVAMLDSNPEP